MWGYWKEYLLSEVMKKNEKLQFLKGEGNYDDKLRI